MKFQFNISLSEKDYLDYNKFVLFKSHYGKKGVIFFRVFFAAIACVYIFCTLWNRNFTFNSFISVLPMAIFVILFELFFPSICAFFFKGSIKRMKKRGKMGYSPSSVVEFYEDVFVEITPDSKIDTKYSAIDRISVVKDKSVYIHMNNVMACILPFSCFASKEQYNEFFGFLKTKCSNIDVY